MFKGTRLRKLLSENYLFLIVLAGIVLVSFSVGPYQNLDSTLEFQATQGVMTWGKPFVVVAGNVINEPPLGFYIYALFFKVFGASIAAGTVLVTLFGFGCTILAYMIGKMLYGKLTGLFTAALFGLSPWELILSRSFLEDAQCLFLSMLCLYIGILAIRKNSVKFAIGAGGLFAAAFLTKFYAVYMLIPLFILYIYSRPKNLKRIAGQLTGFCVPVLTSTYYWYQVILGKPLLYIFIHRDFSDLNAAGVTPTYTFVGTFLLNYGLGYIFVVAVVFSVIIAFSARKHLSKTLIFDFFCLSSIAVVLVVDAVLGVGFNLKVPYTSAVKYDYQALPFFCLIAASLAAKTISLFKSAKSSVKRSRLFLSVFSLSAAVLLAATIFETFCNAHKLSITGYLAFNVKTNLNPAYGYSLFDIQQLNQGSVQFNVQYLGFALILIGIMWSLKQQIMWAIKNPLYNFFGRLFKSMNRWIKAKNNAYRTRGPQ